MYDVLGRQVNVQKDEHCGKLYDVRVYTMHHGADVHVCAQL